MKIVTADFVKSAFSIKDCPAGEFPEIALAGRSNVGKSSFLNKMVSRKGLARTSNTPGRTRLINFFMINGSFYIVDLPGYGYARVPVQMRVEWGKNIQQYLEKRENLVGLILLLDIRHKPTEMDLSLHSWLRQEGIPVLPVVTKADKLSKSQAGNHLKQIIGELELNDQETPSLFSAKTGQGREELWDRIAKSFLNPELTRI